MKRLEGLIDRGVTTSQLTKEICADPKASLALLAKVEKSMEDYQCK